jgi:prepilin-type N-terminal cleavage/methylation domain-containing protein
MVMPELPKAHARRRCGFTIIELLAVMVIISVLAAVAITKFGDSKRRAFIAAMKSDLHNIALIAETKFATENTYATMTAPRGSAGVTLEFSGTGTEWTATARHEALPNFVCEIRSGGGANAEPVCQ